MTYVMLIIGFALLIKGADWIVDGSSKIAQFLRVPSLLVGMTIVAFGTNSPEAMITIMAAVNGNADLAMGNIVGSNILNISMVIGLAACLYPFKVENETIRKEIPFALLGCFVLLILVSDLTLQSAQPNTLTRSDGLILLLFFAIFLYYVFEAAKNGRESIPEDDQPRKWVKHIVYTVLGLAAVVFGSEFVVDSSIKIADQLGMSEALIGLTIVAIGTALPEFITSIIAAVKKETEIALGNIVGSNIFNVFFILGAASLISPFHISADIFTDIIVMIVFTVILLVFSRTQFTIARGEGVLLMIIYIGYLIYIIIRN